MKQNANIDDLVTKTYLDQKLMVFKKEIKKEIVSELEETMLGVRDTLLEAMDPGVVEQVTNVACLPGIQKYAMCMPDGHFSFS